MSFTAFSRPLAACAGVLICVVGCAPPAAPPAPPPPTVSLPKPPPAETAAPRPAGSTARERIAAWEAQRKAKGRVTNFRRDELGGFVASRWAGGFGQCSDSAVATDQGLISDVEWEDLMSADKDVDGDGRPDLVMTARVLGAGERDRTVHVVADRPSGPVKIPVEGVEPFKWASVDDQEEPGPALVVRAAGGGFEKLILAWNGKALVAKETVLVKIDDGYSPHQRGANYFLKAMAGGKTVERDEFDVAHVEVMNGGALMDLRRDGARYYVVWFYTYPPLGVGEGLELAQVILELRKDGWASVSAPHLDFATAGDRDKDGVVDYECFMDEVDLVACKGKETECGTSPIRPRALATWVGDDLSSSAASLKSVYAAWSAHVEEEVASLKGQSSKDECPTERLQIAIDRYLVDRWAGVRVAKAEAGVQALMKGVSFAHCASTNTTPRSFAAIWKNVKYEIAGAEPPKSSSQ